MLQSRSRFLGFYRFAAFLALLAMLVPIGTVLTHHPAAARTLIRICGVDRQNDSQKAPTHKLPPCPVCQHMHLLSSGFVPPSVIVLAERPHPTALTFFRGQSFFLELAFTTSAMPRAPPGLV